MQFTPQWIMSQVLFGEVPVLISYSVDHASDRSWNSLNKKPNSLFLDHNPKKKQND